MSPRERVEAALRWQPVDFVPFTVYESKLPTCAVERRLRNDGLCIVDRRTNAYTGGSAGVTVETHRYAEGGKLLERHVYTTPRGTLTSVTQPLGWTSWTHEHLFKGPDDFEPLLAMIEATSYRPHYEAFAANRRKWADDAFVRAGTPNIPIQTLISSYCGSLTFGYAWMDHRDLVTELIRALHRPFLDACRLIAACPDVIAVNLGGNHAPSILGRAAFEEFVVEPWEEACAILHAGGKLVGSHLDADNRLWADLVAASSLDYVEALTPAPDCDLTLAEARAVWPDKVLWINFPSSVHLRDNDEVAAVTRQLLDEAGDGRGLVVGITEDVPPDRWEATYQVILAELRAAGPRPT